MNSSNEWRVLVFLLGVVFLSTALGQDAPIITTQPTGHSVNLGATVLLRVAASGTAPLLYQWRRDNDNLSGENNSTLSLSNILAPQAGNYTALVANDFGAITSKVAIVQVDPTFTKITAGFLATEGGDSSGCAWGDFDNDGWPDLFVGNGTTKNFLYRNNRNGTFAKLITSVPATEARYGGSWADYNNDGWLDLFAAGPAGNSLYRNNGDGTFTKVSGFAGATSANSWSGSWGDYDRDGWVDLFISNGAGKNNFLLHNSGDGTFTKMTSGAIVSDGGVSIGAAWQDYDGDGWPDLYVANNGSKSFLYHNLGFGSFARVLTGRIATDSQSAIVPDWGDYNNDGQPDLGVGGFGHNLLFQNLGGGDFSKQTNGPLALDAQNSEIVQWIDYDNDGFLDLFSANDGNQNNALYHNNGDGTFNRVTSGSLVNDGGNSAGCAWADYDNDGFLDLFVANWQGSKPNFLYRNNGNTNHWLKVRCVGAASNRDGIGAKVRVKATIRGKSMWQLREISGGTGFGQTSLLAHFGLGDAARIEVLRIEWPSGVIQQTNDVGINQSLTMIEPGQIGKARANGHQMDMIITGLPNSNYAIEISPDLLHWQRLTNLTSSNRTSVFSTQIEAGELMRFYRARMP